jgi:hypothetical protein
MPEHPSYPGGMRSLCILALAASGCGVLDFNIEQAVPEQMIQGSNIPGPIATLFPLPLSLDLSSKIKAQETGPIKSVTLASLELNIKVPTDGSVDWSFVDQVDVFVESTRSGSSLPKTKIASVTSPTGQVLKFVVDGSVNLKPYVDEGAKVDSSGTGRAPTKDLTYDGLGVFTVHPL